MKTAIMLLGLLIVLGSILLLVSTVNIYNWAEDNMDNYTFYLAVIIGRFGIGTLLIAAANKSTYPTAIKFLGYLSVVAAIVFIFIGHGGFQDFMSPLIVSLRPYSPISGLMGIAIGGFLIYAFSSRSSPTSN